MHSVRSEVVLAETQVTPKILQYLYWQIAAKTSACDHCQEMYIEGSVELM